MNFKPFLFTSMVLGIACSSEKPRVDDQGAFDAHEELLAMEAETMSIFESVEQILARDTSLHVFSEELKLMSEKMEAWEKKMVSVGADADHEDHHHPHGHENASTLNETELSNQQEKLKMELDVITNEVSALVDKMMER